MKWKILLWVTLLTIRYKKYYYKKKFSKMILLCVNLPKQTEIRVKYMLTITVNNFSWNCNMKWMKTVFNIRAHTHPVLEARTSENLLLPSISPQRPSLCAHKKYNLLLKCYVSYFVEAAALWALSPVFLNVTSSRKWGLGWFYSFLKVSCALSSILLVIGV